MRDTRYLDGHISGLKRCSIYLFGAGNCGKSTLGILNELGFNVVGFLDNDKTKLGSIIENVPVVLLEDIVMEEDSCFVVSVVGDKQDIIKQLTEAGIEREQIYTVEEICHSEEIKELIDYKIQTDYTYSFAIPESVASENIMTVLYDAQCFAMQKMGGISRYISEIASGIARDEEVDVTVLEGINISNHEFDSRVHVPISQKPDSALLNDLYVRNRVNSNLTNKYLDCLGTVDIYHPTYYENYDVTDYRKKIITVHDMIHELFNMDEETIIKKEKSISGADGIIAVSENTKKDLMEILNIPCEKIRVIYHGNSLNVDVSNDERLIKSPYLLYVGNRGGYKNFELLVYAFSRSFFSNNLCLISFGGVGFNKQEKDFIDSLGLTGKVIHMSGDDRMLANLYVNAEIFVYPSLYEGFGLPILEAMHYGTPVITANTSSMPEVAGNAADYFNPKSSEELQAIIDTLLYDRDRRIRLSKAGIEREKEFSWEKAANETLNYYKHVLEM